MISAKQAKIMSNNATVNLKKQQKLLEKNKNKEFYIPLPFKLKMVEYLIEQAIEVGLTYCNIDNEITPECEECHDCYYKKLKRLQKGYKVQENIINNLNNEVNDLDKENDKYRQAIEQIRQIVEFAIEETLTLGQKNATDKILEIIGEVQNE